MTKPVWAKAIEAAADPPRAKHFLGLLAATKACAALQNPSAEQARILAALFSGAEALTPEALEFPRRKQGLQAEVSAWLTRSLQTRDYAAALQRLRQFKQREMLRLAARDLARLGKVSEITLEISDVADVCLDAVWQICHQQLSQRHGPPSHQDATGRRQPTPGCVLGLGKLGGQELNYSSDVDVIFVYSEEGSVSPVMTNHQFFNRLAEAFIAEVTRVTPDGVLYRIDLRLRPEGDAGPL